MTVPPRRELSGLHGLNNESNSRGTDGTSDIRHLAADPGAEAVVERLDVADVQLSKRHRRLRGVERVNKHQGAVPYNCSNAAAAASARREISRGDGASRLRSSRLTIRFPHSMPMKRSAISPGVPLSRPAHVASVRIL